MQDSYGNQPALEAPEEQVEKEECNLVEVEKGLQESTSTLVEDFTKGLIDATLTLTGLQLVKDTREACARGDPQACKRLELIGDFLKRIRPKQVQSN